MKHLALHALAASGSPLSVRDAVDQNSVSTTDKPLIDSEALQDTIRAENLIARAKHLYEMAKLSQSEQTPATRVIGSKGHNATLDYIHDTLKNLSDYYTVSRQPFVVASGQAYRGSLDIDGNRFIYAVPVELTPPTDYQHIIGELVVVANYGCNESDYPPELKANIALIDGSGNCSYSTKSELAGKAGAMAAVLTRKKHDKQPFPGSLEDPLPNHVATFALDSYSSIEIELLIEYKSPVQVKASIQGWAAHTTTDNIIAQTIEGDPDNCVMVGAHSDSVHLGPGINDNGSGLLALLEVAIQLAKFKVNNCVRFAWFSAEEEGLLGSSYYVHNLTPGENRKIRVFMDYDMLASPNYVYHIYNGQNSNHPVGSQELRDLYVDWYTAHGLNYTLVPFDGRSDYDPFLKAGIPAGGVHAGVDGWKKEEEYEKFGGLLRHLYDWCYHKMCDDVSNLNLIAWEVNTKLVAHALATYARSLEGFPERRRRWT
ncbi:hypothetical protein V8F20_012792 [Naviculisporaceae sp. PSN 640]